MLERDTPYPLENPNDFTHLESEFSALPPSLAEGYRQVESQASQAFVRQFGQYLSAGQRTYFENRQILFTDHRAAEFFVNDWPEGIHSINAEDANIDGSIFLSYSVETPVEERTETQQENGSATLHQSWAGRIVVHPLAEGEAVPVGGEWLMSKEAFFERIDSLDFGAATEAMIPFIYSTELAETTVHEKVHGAQDWRLPLPILEAAAHYYERVVAREQNWKERHMARPMETFADYFEQCVKELGEDVHMLIFGNLDSARRKEILEAMKVRFSAEQIEQLSQDDAMGGETVYWRKESVDSAELSTV